MPEVSASRVPSQPPPIFISLGAFGAAEVRRHGQAWFTRLTAQAGADGVEIRGELLVDGEPELDLIAGAIEDGALQCVFSSPEGLWAADGSLDDRALASALATAQRLAAPRVKMSIGAYGAASSHSLAGLRSRLADTPIELLIENDQTVSAGTLPAIQRFFEQSAANGLTLGMTFDMGNWHWQGECPLLAARACAPLVSYVHCKGVQHQPKRWSAVPIVDSQAPWRAILANLPTDVPWAIEYPLIGDDLRTVAEQGAVQLREIARSMS